MINSNISDYTNALSSIRDSEEIIGQVNIYFSEEIAASKFLNELLQKIDKIIRTHPETKSFQISYPNLRALEMLDALYGEEITYQVIENTQKIVIYFDSTIPEEEISSSQTKPSFWTSLLRKIRRPPMEEEEEEALQEPSEPPTTVPSHLKETIPAFLRRTKTSPPEEDELPEEESSTDVLSTAETFNCSDDSSTKENL